MVKNTLSGMELTKAYRAMTTETALSNPEPHPGARLIMPPFSTPNTRSPRRLLTTAPQAHDQLIMALLWAERAKEAQLAKERAVKLGVFPSLDQRPSEVRGVGAGAVSWEYRGRGALCEVRGPGGAGDVSGGVMEVRPP